MCGYYYYEWGPVGCPSVCVRCDKPKVLPAERVGRVLEVALT